MKPSIFLCSLLVTFFMFSCQKKVDWLVDPVTKEVLDSTQNQQNSSEVLSRIVSVTGTETLESNFTYDSSNHLLSEHRQGIENGVPIDTYKKYYRDTTGKIIKVAAKIKQQPDSIFTVVVYDDYYTNILLHTLSNLKIQGTAIRDSVVYVYDGNGHIGIQKTFRLKPNSTYTLYQQQEFAYSGNNLVKSKQYVDSSNTAVMVLAAEYNYTYDTRINPLQLHNEAVLTGSPERASASNLVAIDLENKMVPSDNFKVESKLLYSPNRKPMYCTSIKSPLGTVSVLTYYYK